MAIIGKISAAGLFATILVSTTPALADIALHGSGTVGRGIVLPNIEAIQETSGVTLEVVVNGSGNGLKDLAAGRADMAMISAPIEVEADIVNTATPGALDIGNMQVFEIGSAEIFFVVHPDNPVQSLTADQMLAVLTGEVDNWSGLGGADAPIVVAVEVPGNGTRANVQSIFMEGRDFAAGARTVRDLGQVVAIVSQQPMAIGYGNASSISDGSVAVIDGLVVDQPLALVTSGDPTADMQSLIDAVQGLD